MKKPLLFLAAGVLFFTILGAGCNSSVSDYRMNGDTLALASQTSTPVVNPPVTVSSTLGRVFENQYMKVSIPEGWTATPVASNTAAVNITKGKYILYINTEALQASGADGGRQAEITEGAPSADAVITNQPNECGISDKQPIYEGYFRVDYFMDSQAKKNGCKAPTQGTVWFFSYITDSRGGYFNYYPPESNGETKAWVITMAYNSKDVNKLPAKDNDELDTMIAEMTNIAKNLVIKKK
jgi:hypothetical protein